MHHIFHANALDVCPYLCHQLIGAISFEHMSCRDSPSIEYRYIASLASGILRSNLNLQIRIIWTMTMGSQQNEPFAAVCAQERLAHRYVVREEMVYEAFGAIIPHLSSVILSALLPNPNFSSQPFESSTLSFLWDV